MCFFSIKIYERILTIKAVWKVGVPGPYCHASTHFDIEFPRGSCVVLGFYCNRTLILMSVGLNGWSCFCDDKMEMVVYLVIVYTKGHIS